METLSTSISTFTNGNIPKSHPRNHLLHQQQQQQQQQPSIPSTSSTKCKSTKISKKSTNPLPPPPHVNYSSSSRSSSKRPSTGYAVALLDAARRHDAVDAVRRDVRRLSRWLRDDQLRHVMADPSTPTKAEIEILKEVVRQGRFQKHLGKLVKLLAQKGKLDLLGQVLSEFATFYHHLSRNVNANDQLLLLPPRLKMDQTHILEIVGRIRRLTLITS